MFLFSPSPPSPSPRRAALAGRAGEQQARRTWTVPIHTRVGWSGKRGTGEGEKSSRAGIAYLYRFTGKGAERRLPCHFANVCTKDRLLRDVAMGYGVGGGVGRLKLPSKCFSRSPSGDVVFTGDGS